MKKLYIIMGLLLTFIFLVGCENTEPASCPNIETPEKFFPVKGSELISLDASGITISDGYKIAPSEKQTNPFTDFGEAICHKGKEAGENIDNTYCGQLMLQKLITNDAGDIIEEEIIGVEFIFDKESKLIDTKCFK